MRLMNTPSYKVIPDSGCDLGFPIDYNVLGDAKKTCKHGKIWLLLFQSLWEDWSESKGFGEIVNGHHDCSAAEREKGRSVIKSMARWNHGR